MALSLSALALVASHAGAQGSPPPTTPLPARAIVNTLPALTLSSSVLPNGAGSLILSLPPNTQLPDKARIALFEAGGMARVADVSRRFTATGNGLQATINIEGASPGRYELRVVNNDKLRSPLTQDAPLLVPGVEREPGWWILNGSPFIAPASQSSSNDSEPAPKTNLPLFLPGLRRDLSAKPKPITRDIALPTSVQFKLWPLPSLYEMAQPNYDFGALQTKLTRDLADARAKGDGGYAGFAISRSGEAPKSVGAERTALIRLQTMRDAVAPDAALVLIVSGDGTSVVEDDQLAPLCDAIEVRLGLFSGTELTVGTYMNRSSWGVKIARRITEEQANYDLPVIYDPSTTDEGERLNFDALLSGATMVVGNTSPLNPVIQRNLPLFVGSVTLEDSGVLPTGDGDDNYALVTAGRLRAAGRIPQLARAIPAPGDDKGKKPNPEAFYAHIDAKTTAVTLEALWRTAQAGGRIYLEGSPDPAGPLAARMKDLGDGTLTALPAPQPSTLKLNDPWIFGTLRGQTMNVMQTATIQLAPATIASQIKPQEGLDQLTAPRVVATLEDGSPGMILAPVGKGQVLWSPYAMHDTPPTAYDAAIAGWLGPALVRLHAQDGRSDVTALRVAMRRSAKGTLLVALTNTGTSDVKTDVGVDSAPTVCLNLATETELPVTTYGYEGKVTATVPANGYLLLAFAADRKTLDAERSTARLKAKLR